MSSPATLLAQAAAPGLAASAAGPGVNLPHGIRGAVSPYPGWLLLVAFLVALALVAATSLLLWRWYKRRRARRLPAPSDPWQELISSLRALTPASPFTKAAQSEFYAVLSLLLREALERRSGLPATDRTVPELRGLVGRQPLPCLSDAETEAVLGFLDRSDLVKFAAAPSGDLEARQAAAQVLVWVERLRPAPSEAATGVPLSPQEASRAPS